MKRTKFPSPLPSLIPAPSKGGNLALARQVIGQAPLIAAKGLTQDLLAVHSLSLSALMHEIQRPDVLLDEDSIPHKLILERVSSIQKDILAASHALLKLEEALAPKEEKTSSKIESRAIASGDKEPPNRPAPVIEKPLDVSTIVLELAEKQ
jgi:hypothetical protein